MFNFNTLRSVHLEITNNCQASCPMCPRNIHGGVDNPLLKINSWTLEDFQTIITHELLKQLDEITFCGNFGDPIINNNLVDMCRHAATINPNIAIYVHTNGSARPAAWWKDLARSLPKQHRVIFALDGLADTHHLYRQGTVYELILDNAKTFIQSGGIAEWVFIRFAHNQHQVSEAEQSSKLLGFSMFSVKNSRRFGKSFPVIDNAGNVTHHLNQPTDSIIQLVDRVALEECLSQPSDIDCFAFKEDEVYIDAHYTLMPCCMLASFLYTSYDIDLLKKYDLYDDTIPEIVGQQVKSQVLSLVNEFGGLDALNTLTNPIKSIINTSAWQTILTNKWVNNDSPACSIICGSRSPYIKVSEQKSIIKVIKDV